MVGVAEHEPHGADLVARGAPQMQAVGLGLGLGRRRGALEHAHDIRAVGRFVDGRLRYDAT